MRGLSSSRVVGDHRNCWPLQETRTTSPCFLCRTDGHRARSAAGTSSASATGGPSEMLSRFRDPDADVMGLGDNNGVGVLCCVFVIFVCMSVGCGHAPMLHAAAYGV